MSNSIVRLADVRSYRRNWSDRELARFHRVVAALWSVGLSVETDHGVTDEGDPWFVFCDADSGEVIADFARISGKYVACARWLKGSLTAPDLRDLVERFVDRCPGRRVASTSGHPPPAVGERRRGPGRRRTSSSANR